MPGTSFMNSPVPAKRIQPIVYFIGFTAALAGLLFRLGRGVISGAIEFIRKDLQGR